MWRGWRGEECFHVSVWSSLAVLAGLFQKLDQTEDVGKDDTVVSLMRAHKGEGPQKQDDKLIFFSPGHHTRKIQRAVVNKDDRGLIYHLWFVEYTQHSLYHNQRDTCIGSTYIWCKCLRTKPWLWLTYTNVCAMPTENMQKSQYCDCICVTFFPSLIYIFLYCSETDSPNGTNQTLS